MINIGRASAAGTSILTLQALPVISWSLQSFQSSKVGLNNFSPDFADNTLSDLRAIADDSFTLSSPSIHHREDDAGASAQFELASAVSRQT